MATAYKILGQEVFPWGNASSVVYTVPPNTSTIVSSIAIANQSEYGTAQVAIELVKSGESANGPYSASKQLFFGKPSLAKMSNLIISSGITLSSGDKIICHGDLIGANAVSYNIFGTEIS